MNILQITLIEKAGYDNGFENAESINPQRVELSSSRHPTHAQVTQDKGSSTYRINLEQAPVSLMVELQREFSSENESGLFLCENEAQLHRFLRRAAALSRALPNQAVNDYLVLVADELAKLPAAITGTEVERMVRQRVGQNKYRSAMLDYWGGACAVTGVQITELLRASHALPWAECQSDAQRLDVFNGFLLSANLDALFDRFLISFDKYGQILFGPSVDLKQLLSVGIEPNMRLRWLDAKHEVYLEHHRKRTMLEEHKST